jgi:hypothetical protein
MKKRLAKKVLMQQESRPHKAHRVHEATATIQKVVKRAEKKA